MNPKILKLKAKIAEKRSAANKILETVAASAETRDMSPDEKSQFDGLVSELETLKNQVSQMQALDDQEDADEAESASVAEAARSARRSRPIGDAPAAHTEKRTYSVLRAIRAAVDQRPLDGLEGEVNREMVRRTGRDAKGFFLPLGSDPEIRALMAGGPRAEVRTDLTTTTGAGAVFTSVELPMIDLLRNRLVVRELGAKILTGMKGAFAISRQTGSATIYWLAEGSSATPSAPAVDQVALTPKVAIALTSISRKFLLQSSVDAEQLVRDDLAATLAHEWDRVAINGSGTTQPLGILQNTGITGSTANQALQGGTNGAALSFGQVIGMETQVANANADAGSLKFLTNASQRGKLKQAPVLGSTFPTFIYTQGNGPGTGEVNGYPVLVSNVVPANLTKGTASGICSAVIFGNWNDLIIASYDDIADVLVNPYTLQAAGAVTLSMEMAMDCAVRHNESFAVVSDAL